VTSGDDDPCTHFDSCGSPQECGCQGAAICEDGASVRGNTALPTSEWTVEANWSCVLTAFRDSLPGSLYVYVELFDGDGLDDGSYYDQIVALGDGTAVFTRLHGLAGLSGTRYDAARHVQVRPSSYFDACLTSGLPADTSSCLMDWYLEDLCTAPACCPQTLDSGGLPECESGSGG